MFPSKRSFWMRGLSSIVLVAFVFNTLFMNASAHAQMSAMLANMPLPGTRVDVSPAYDPVMMKGILVYPGEPFKIGFVIDQADAGISGEAFKDECGRLIRYFFAALTVPEKDMWVNLSPYEKDRMIPERFSYTDMGGDLLAQDYILKQLAASLTYPDAQLGKDFWQEVYRRAGRVDSAIDTINKVWITPKDAEVYVHGQGAFVVHGQMDVLLDKDYVALNKQAQSLGIENAMAEARAGIAQQAYQDVFKEMILPEIRKDVNGGRQFAAIRQVYNAMVLATWFKRNLRQNILNQVYAGKNTVSGIDVNDEAYKQRLYDQYLDSLKRGAYNYIKEEFDEAVQEPVAVKHFSGGIEFTGFTEGTTVFHQSDDPQRARLVSLRAPVIVDVGILLGDQRPGFERMGTVLGESSVPGILSVTALTAPQQSTASETKPVIVLPARGHITLKSMLPDPSPLSLGLSAVDESLDKAQAAPQRMGWKKILALTALAGAMFSSGSLVASSEAAVFHADDRGGIVAVVEKGDTAGHILEQVRVAYNAADREGYNASSLKGGLWGKDGVVSRMGGFVGVRPVLQPGDALTFSKEIVPSTVAANLLHPLAAAPALEPLPVMAPVLEPLATSVQSEDAVQPEASAPSSPFTWSFPDLRARIGAMTEQVSSGSDALARSLASSIKGNGLGWLQWVSACGLFFISLGRWVASSLKRRTDGGPEVGSENMDKPMGDRERRVFIRREIEQQDPFIAEARRQANLLTREIVGMFRRGLTDVPGADGRDADSDVRETLQQHLGIFLAEALSSRADHVEINENVEGKSRELAARYRDLTGGQAGLVKDVGDFVEAELEPLARKAVVQAVSEFREGFFTAEDLDLYRLVVKAQVDRFIVFDGKLSVKDVVKESAVQIREILKQKGLVIDPQAAYTDTDVDDLVPSVEQKSISSAGVSTAHKIPWQEDVLAAGSGAAAAWLGGANGMGTLMATGLAPVIYRMGMVAALWVHEMGHMLKGGWQAFDLDNLRAHVSLKNWLGALVPFSGSVPQAEVHVYDTTSPIEDKQIRRFGFWTSALVALGQFAAVHTAAIHVTPYVFPFSLGAFWVLLQSGKTDLWDQFKGNIRRGFYYCGVASLVRVRREESRQIVSDDSRKLFAQMGAITDIRGQQAAGVRVMAQDNQGNVYLVGARMVNDKRGDLPQSLDRKLARAISKAKADGLTGLDDKEVILAHYRFGTSSAPAVNETHPHQWMAERTVPIWSMGAQGTLVKQDKILGTSIGHNGDFDYFRIYDEWVSNETMGLWLERVLHTPNDTKGDSPKVAGVMDLMFTQGIWPAAVRLGYYFEVARSVREVFAGMEPARNARNTALSDVVIERIGDIFEQGFERILPEILLPKAATLRDLWVTPETAGDDIIRKAQADRLARFEADMVSRLSSVKLCQAWGEVRLRAFVHRTVEAFFENDLYMTVRKFFDRVEHSNNTFGLVVGSTLKPDGVVLAARGQPMTIGINEDAGLVLAASEPAAVKVSTDGDYTTDRFALDQRYRGEIVDVAVGGARPAQGILKVYTRDLGRELTRQEVVARYEPLPPYKKNPYITPLLELDRDDPVGRDIRDIPQVLDQIRTDWQNKDSLNRQTADELLLRLTQKAIERQIKRTSGAYMQIPGRLAGVAQGLMLGWQGMLGAGNSTLEDMMRPLLQRYLQGFVARSFEQSRIDGRISSYAMRLAKDLLTGARAENEVHALVNGFMSVELKALIEDEWVASSGRVKDFNKKIKTYVKSRLELFLSMPQVVPVVPGGAEINAQLKAVFHELGIEAGVPKRAEEYDLFINGIETSLWIGEQFAADLMRVFPGLRVGVASANKVLENVAEQKIGPNTVVLCISQSGQTFGSLNSTILLNGKLKEMSQEEVQYRAAQRLEAVTQGQVFVMTGEVDTLMGRAVGQQYQADAPFSRRIFSNLTGFRPAEASTVTGAATYATLNELLLVLAQGLGHAFPESRPFELTVSQEDIKDLTGMRDKLIAETERVVGVDRYGEALISDENREIRKSSGRWARHILDVPFARVASYVHLYAAVVGGFLVVDKVASFSPWPVPSWVTSHLQLGVFLFFSAGVTWLKRFLDGRTVLARTGNRAIVIGGPSVVHQSLEIFVSKLFALSRAGTAVDVHGSNPDDHMVHRFAHRVLRGSLIWMGIPDGRMDKLKRMESAYMMTAKQAMGIQNLGVGAEVVMVTRERDHNPNASFTDITLAGGPATDKEHLQKLAYGRYEALLQLISGNVYFWNMAKKVSTLGLAPAWRWMWPWGWNMYRTQSGTRIATTASPKAPPPSVDNAAASDLTPGGIDMSSHWLDLKEIRGVLGADVPVPVSRHVPADVGRLTPYILDIRPMAQSNLQILLMN
ncbi:MAG: hypothetical protein HQL17_00315 [Candidatus Omnitrophica bacterium]|nr:hypothetical protein [Candidatus Omnitrophota bacterium]